MYKYNFLLCSTNLITAAQIQCQCGYKGKLPLLSFVENYNKT